MAEFLTSITDALLNTLGLGPQQVDWSTRLREEITLEAPDGTIFNARWTGGPRSVDNSIARFKFPEIPGEKVQDLRAGADVYDLVVIFEGKNNDLNASAFVDTLKRNTGAWIIEHPVRGPVSLIWMNSVENIDPTESGNITAVATTWIEPLPETAADSAAKAQADADRAAFQANAAAAEQFADAAKQNGPGQIQSIVSTAGRALTKVSKTLAAIENAQIIDPRVTAIITGIQNTLSGDTIDTDQLSGQIQQVIGIYSPGQTSSVSAIAMYGDFITDALTDVPTQPTDEGLSQIATTELTVCAGITAACQSALIGGLTSRQQALTAAANLADMFDTVTNALDDIRVLYEDRTIDLAYFSQQNSYADILSAVEKAIRFLLFSIRSLPPERLVTLTEDKSTLQIAHDEYGNIGNSESETFYLDLLLETNGLMDDDIYWLPRGRQLLIYA